MNHEKAFNFRDTLASFWGNVESKAGYKCLFVLLMGVYGATIGTFFALLMLYGYELKWIFTLIGIGFGIGVILSPLQYKQYKKKYQKYLENEQSNQTKNTSLFIDKLNE